MNASAHDPAAEANSTRIIHVVDDDGAVREALADLLQSMDYVVAQYRSAADFLAATMPDSSGCLILDVRLPGASGLELQEALIRSGNRLPVIFMTGHGDIQMSVQSMKAGAVDFLTKPFRDQDMLDAVAAALKLDGRQRAVSSELVTLRATRSTLTPRERQVMDLVVVGKMNKQIAGELSLSEVTIKVHRASVMRKMGARSVAQLARIAERLQE